jgi:Putative Ig domain.
MTNRLIKNKRDHKRLRAIITENTVVPTVTPATGALTAGVNGTPYAGVTIAMTNAVGAPHYSIASGALPTGLTLNGATGVIAGTPTETVAAKAVSIQATDDFGNTKTVAYTITITAT